MNIYLNTMQIMGLAAKLDPDRKYNLPMSIAEEFAKAAADNAVREVVGRILQGTHKHKIQQGNGDFVCYIDGNVFNELKALVTEKGEE